MKVDGKAVETKSPGCAEENCPLTGEWTLDASKYAVGSHTVEVIATDGVKLTTTKSLTINLAKDTTAPTLTTTGGFFSGPEGWLEQKSYAATVQAKDIGGYGLTTLNFKLDGTSVQSKTQACPKGGCEALITKTMNLELYDGGAHTAEVVANDGAGNTTTKSWTINVDPSGSVPDGEAVATLEAMEDTEPEAAIIAPTVEVISAEERADGNHPSLEEKEGGIVSVGTPVEARLETGSEHALVIEATEGEMEVTPVGPLGLGSESKIVADIAAVSSNTATGTDTVVRPKYNGALQFQSVREFTAPETFSWEVNLLSGQTLKALEGGMTAAVYYKDGSEAMLIEAMPAADAVGHAVPTHLTVSGGNIVTLTVEHKKGTYVYPVIAGPSFEVGYVNVEVIAPPPPPEEYWESSELHVSAPEPIPAAEASASTTGGKRQEFVRVVCGHTSFYPRTADESYSQACGNPFKDEPGYATPWQMAMRGAFLYKPGAWAEQKGAKACDQAAYEVSITWVYGVKEAYECRYGPKTSDGNGGQSVTGGHYLRAQARWEVGHFSRCAGDCNGTPNPTIWEDKAQELHLWPSGAVERAVP